MYSFTKPLHGKYIDSKLGGMLSSACRSGTRLKEESAMYRFVALFAAVVAAVLSVADSFPGPR
jgi:hypothetical protein